MLRAHPLQSICGISVVPNDYESLKRYNLAEIFEPTPKVLPKVKAKDESEGQTQTETTNEEVADRVV